MTISRTIKARRINTIITMPIWIVVLLFNKRIMDRKEILIGLSLFLAFVGLAAWPVITTIGYMAY